MNSLQDMNWAQTTKAMQNSRDLLKATWNMEEEKVAQYIQQAHLETSMLQYNDENALAYTIYLAYIVAKDYYTMIREFPTGKGFADLVFIPVDDHPAMILELKYDQNANTAISQIKNKHYDFGLGHYKDRLLLVGISYDCQTKNTPVSSKSTNKKRAVTSK